MIITQPHRGDTVCNRVDGHGVMIVTRLPTPLGASGVPNADPDESSNASFAPGNTYANPGAVNTNFFYQPNRHLHEGVLREMVKQLRVTLICDLLKCRARKILRNLTPTSTDTRAPSVPFSRGGIRTIRTRRWAMSSGLTLSIAKWPTIAGILGWDHARERSYLTRGGQGRRRNPRYLQARLEMVARDINRQHPRHRPRSPRYRQALPLTCPVPEARVPVLGWTLVRCSRKLGRTRKQNPMLQQQLQEQELKKVVPDLPDVESGQWAL